MIVITAPTGLIGGQVVRRLLAAGEQVRVVARDPSRLAPATREHVDVVAGSHRDPAVLEQAFDGADAVFWLVPPDPRADSVRAAFVDFSRAASTYFAQAPGLRVVGISALGRDTPVAGKAGYVTGSLAMDDLITGTGVSYRALTMPSFMDNVSRQVAAIRDSGVFTSPISGDRAMPSCATRDIAAVAAGLLVDRTWSSSSEVPVLGPEDLSFHDMAAIMSDVLERPIRFQQVPAEALRQRLVANGMSEAMAQGMVEMALAKDAGLDNAAVRTPASATPTTFRQWCESELAPAVVGPAH